MCPQNSRTVFALVGGGNDTWGRIRLYYADEQADSPGQPSAIGTHIGGAKLCDSVASGGGNPTQVKILGDTAFVATVGVGLQQVDLADAAKERTDAVRYSVGQYSAGPSPPDISMMIRGIEVFPPLSAEASSFVIASVQGKGLMAWRVSESAPAPVKRLDFPSCVNATGSLRMQLIQNYAFTHVASDGSRIPKTEHLLLVAGGSAGLLVYGLTPSGGSLDIRLLDVVPTAGPVYDVAMDSRRGIAYAATYSAGVTMMDLKDPLREPPLPDCAAWQSQYPGKPYGFLDRNGDGQDDRITGILPAQSGSNATLVVDSETGLLYVGMKGAGSGVHMIGARQPRMEFVLNDPARPGQYKIPGYLSAFDGDQPRLALWLPGGAGASINNAEIELFDRKGFPETAQKDASGNNVVTTVYRNNISLIRQSAKKTDSKYNFYVQDPAQVVKLGMTYDPASPDPTLMVSRQSGSLRGTANAPAWGNAGTTWGRTISVERDVARPWVETGLGERWSQTFLANESDPAFPAVDHSKKYFYMGANHTYKPVVHFDPPVFAGRVTCELVRQDAEIAGSTSWFVFFWNRVLEPKISIVGHEVTPSQTPDALVFRLSGKEIARVPLLVTVPRIQLSQYSLASLSRFPQPSDPELSTVQIALWDQAFEMVGSPSISVGDLHNGLREEDNFLGSDTRTFYIRIYDPVAETDPSQVNETVAEWYTITEGGQTDDKPENSAITLVEQGRGTGVFCSKALGLVSDFVDLGTPTNTGIAGRQGPSAHGQKDYRLRRTDVYNGLSGKVKVEYQPVSSEGVSHSWVVPVFRRSPDERKSVTIHFVTFRDTARGIYGADAEFPGFIARAKQKIMSRLAVAGIEPRFIYDPSLDTIDVNGGAPDTSQVSKGTTTAGLFNASQDQLALVNHIRNMLAEEPTQGDTIWMLFFARFKDRASIGQASGDLWCNNCPTRNVVFIGYRDVEDYDFTEPHELVHMFGVRHPCEIADASCMGSGYYFSNLMWPEQSYPLPTSPTRFQSAYGTTLHLVSST